VVAVVDVGNTNAHLGLYEGELLTRKFKCPTTTDLVEEKMVEFLNAHRIEGIAIASVIPQLTPRLVKGIKKMLKINPLVISPKLDCHLKYKYCKPETLGADRIANVVGGLARYRKDLIVLDFGTATTIDIAFRNGVYLGGLIMPGLNSQFEILAEKTALLPRVTLKKDIKMIGQTTEECIQSGVLNGTVAMVQRLIRSITSECKKKFYCVTTGGLGQIIYSRVPDIKSYDPDLCLYGILKVYQYNVKRASS
jgi:type III pantothenate kinase